MPPQTETRNRLFPFQIIVNADIHIVLKLDSQAQSIVGQDASRPQLAERREDCPAATPCHAPYAAVYMLPEFQLGGNLVVVAQGV